MGKITLSIASAVLYSAFLMLSACSTSPDLVDATREPAPDVVQSPTPGNAAGESARQEIAKASGLGTVEYAEENRIECKKRRQTGSRIRRSTCGDYLESRPIRSVTAKDPALIGSSIGTGPPIN